MPRPTRLVRSLRIIGFCLLAALRPMTPARAEPLLLCGMDEVFLIDSAQAEQGKVEKLWSWKAADRDELPPSVRGRFGATDECKPIDDGAKVLIASSGGACALVERASGRALWYAVARNAHSLELLPGERVVVACSVGDEGNRLLVFDLSRSNEPICQSPLLSAHGVVWDGQRKCLWALGGQSLNRYELRDWKSDQPSLGPLASHSLPDQGGHDLQAVPSGADLIVTTGRNVYLFDRETGEFRLHPALGGRAHVKCVAVHPANGRTAFVQASDANWWSDRFGLLDPNAEAPLKGERLYKARWLPAPAAR